MREHLIHQLVNFALDDSLAVGTCSKKYIKLIDAQPFPEWLKRLLSHHWPTKSGHVWPCYDFFDHKQIFSHYLFERSVAQEMLPVAHGPNGDTMVIKFNDDAAEVGFLCHEEVDEAEKLADAYSQVTPTIEEFFLRVHDRLFLPADSYSAYGFGDLLSEMRRPPGRGK